MDINWIGYVHWGPPLRMTADLEMKGIVRDVRSNVAIFTECTSLVRLRWKRTRYKVD